MLIAPSRQFKHPLAPFAGLRALVALFALSIVSASAAHAAPDDFSGTWRLDTAQSDSMDPMLERCGVGAAERAVATAFEPTVTIRQEGDRLKIRQETFASNIDNQMILDGKQRATQTPLGKMLVKATALKSGAIRTETVTRCERNGVSMEMTTTRSLST